MVQWTVESLLYHITDSNYTIQGTLKSKSIRNVASLHAGTPDDVTFCSSEEYKGILSISQSNERVILCKKKHAGTCVSQS